MAAYTTELTKIRDLIEKNPRGLTISEISAKLGLNRNSVAKYLDVFTVSGEIDLRPVGRAKLYYPTRRVPLANLLDHSSDNICIIDENENITQVNTNFINLLKKKRDEILGQKLSNVFKSEPYRKIAELRNGKTVDQIEINGYFFRAKQIPTVFLDGTNGTTIILGDITKEIRHIQELKESENRFHTFVRASSSGMVLFDEDLMVLEINDAALQFTGLSRDQVVNAHIQDFRDNSDLAREQYSKYLEVLNHKIDNYIHDFVFPSHLGGKRVIVSVFAAGSGLGMVVTDITEL